MYVWIHHIALYVIPIIASFFHTGDVIPVIACDTLNLSKHFAILYLYSNCSIDIKIMTQII